MKEDTATEKLCPIDSELSTCVGSACMAWSYLKSVKAADGSVFYEDTGLKTKHGYCRLVNDKKRRE